MINNLQPTNPITTQLRQRQTRQGHPRQEQTREIPPRETPPRETPPRETPPREEPAQYLHDGYYDDNGDGDADVRANEQNNNPVGCTYIDFNILVLFIKYILIKDLYTLLQIVPVKGRNRSSLSLSQ